MIGIGKWAVGYKSKETYGQTRVLGNLEMKHIGAKQGLVKAKGSWVTEDTPPSKS